MRDLSRAILPATVFVLSAPQLWSAGFFIPNQSVDASARGNAWVASADHAAAVHYNPAGLSQLTGPSLEAGVYTIHLGNEATIGGTTYEAEGKWQPVPHIYYARPINEDFSFGVGLNSPFGLGTNWDTTTPFAAVATESMLRYLRASAVVSYQINECLSIGGGLSLNYADGTLEQFPGFPVKFEGDGFSATWIAGVHYQPHEQHSFGAVYRSDADFDLKGTFASPLGTAPAFLDFYTPATAAVGYAFRPTQKLTIEANVEWVGWDELTALANNFNPAGPIPFFWQDTFIYEIGFSYRLDNGLTLNAGYDYNESAQPDAFYNPAVADADRHWLNIGVTGEREDWSWSLAYQYGFSERTVTGSGIGTDGTYDAEHHAVMGGVRFQF